MIRLTGRAINKVTIFRATQETSTDLHFEVIDTKTNKTQWLDFNTGVFGWVVQPITSGVLFDCYEKSTMYNDKNNIIIINKHDSGFEMEEGVLQCLENIDSNEYFTKEEIEQVSKLYPPMEGVDKYLKEQRKIVKKEANYNLSVDNFKKIR